MMAELQTNFNVAPFYDDYDEDKQYYRILFRPATAVQARELTQLQTMMQKQISRFGDSIYKDGSVVEGCNFTSYPKLSQIKFKDGTSETIDFSLLIKNNTDVANVQSHLTNSYLLVSNTTGLRAAIFDAFVGAESVVNQGSADTNRAYVLYLNSGNNSGQEVKTFSTSSELINVYSPAQDKNASAPLVATNKVGYTYTLSSNSTVNALGVGYGIHVGQGVIYQKGFFLKTLADNFMIREHTSNAAGIKVGFNTAEYIVKPAEDSSLYDNSIGSSNQNAPGAYRLKLVPSPVAYDASDPAVTIPKDFFPILDYDGGDGRPVTVNSGNPELSALGDLIAKRTKEESGDYIVKPFQVNVEPTANSQSFYYTASPGIAYIDGYRVEYLTTRKVEVPRAIYSETKNNMRSTVNFGSYVPIRDVVGIFDVGGNQDIGIYSANQYAISLTPSISSPAGTLVGNANIRAVTFSSGTKGTGTAEYLLYLSNIRMRAGYSFATSAKSFYVNGTYGPIFADIYQANNKSELYESNSKLLLLDTGLKGVKTLSNVTNDITDNDTSYIYRTTSAATTLSRGAGLATAAIVITADEYNYGAASVTDSISEDIHVMFAQDTVSNLYVTSAGFATPTVGRGTLGVNNTIITCTAATDGTGSFVTNIGTIDQNPKVGENIRLNIAGTASYSYHTLTSASRSSPGTTATITPGFTGSTSAITTVVIAGTGGQFTCSATTLAVGDRVVITGTSGGTGSITSYTAGTAYKISAITGTAPNVTGFTLTTLSGAALVTTAGTPTGLTYARVIDGTIELFKFHKRGSYVNFTGTTNTIIFSATVDGDVRTMAITLGMDLFPSTDTWSVYAQTPIIRTGAVPIQKVVRKNTHIAINCASHAAGTTGPWSLGMPDVVKITGVYVGTTWANTNINRKDWFDLDNGQQDGYYGLAQLKVKPAYQSALQTTSRLMVTMNHLTPNITSSQATFFSIDSYSLDDANTANTSAIATAEIPIYVTSTGDIYDLRNHLDLRPVLANTANIFTSNAIPGMTINPSNNQSVYYSTVGPKIAIEPDSNFSYNAQYYLPRMDALLISKEGALITKVGSATINPKPPTLNNAGLKIADIYVPPYPSLTFSEAE